MDDKTSSDASPAPSSVTESTANATVETLGEDTATSMDETNTANELNGKPATGAEQHTDQLPANATDRTASADTDSEPTTTDPWKPVTDASVKIQKSRMSESNESLNSTADTIVPDDEPAAPEATADSNRGDAAAAAAPALPPRAKSATGSSSSNNATVAVLPGGGTQQQQRQNVSFFEHSVVIRPNGQTKLVSASGGRKSAAMILKAPAQQTQPPPSGGAATTSAEDFDLSKIQQQLQQQQPPAQQSHHAAASAPPTQRILISSGNVPLQSAAVIVHSSGSNTNSNSSSTSTLSGNAPPNNADSNNAPSSVAADRGQQGCGQGPGLIKPGQARVIMFCQPSSHPFQTRNILLEPDQEVKVGRSITRNRVSENNAIFDCKVLSRNHAQVWMSDGKFYIRVSVVWSVWRVNSFATTCLIMHNPIPRTRPAATAPSSTTIGSA